MELKERLPMGSSVLITRGSPHTTHRGKAPLKHSGEIKNISGTRQILTAIDCGESKEGGIEMKEDPISLSPV